MNAKPKSSAQAAADRDNAAFFQRKAKKAFESGRILWGLYFLDAADFYAEPTLEQVSERVQMLLQAMAQLPERTSL